MDVFCIVQETIHISDQIKKRTLAAPLAYNNCKAHSMRVVVLNDDGTTADMTGVGVTGSMIRADKKTVEPINGAVTGNVAEIILPASCYVAPGRFMFTLNLTKMTPTTGVSAFSTSTAYAIGDLVVYNNVVYRFTSAHAAGAWTGTDAVPDAASRTVMWVDGIVERNTTDDLVDPGTPISNIEQAIGGANAAAAAATSAAAAANEAAQIASTKVNKPSSGNGTSGQVLQTNGDGTTAWVDQTGGGGSGEDDTAKWSAVDTVITNLETLIQQLVYSVQNNNSAATIAAIETLHSILSGTATVYDISKTLSHCTISNAATSVVQNASYSANLSADTGYTLGTVTVTMGGTDITSTAYSNGAISIASVTGNIAITASAVANTYTVTNTLSNCTNSNNATTATHGSSYSGTITATSGYTLSSVAVTMGGTDITSTAYNSGTGAISIASITGNIAITASATARTVSSIDATFTQGGNTIYDSTPLNDLKQYLVVTATYSDATTETVSSNNYSLSGTLTVGTSTITVSYGGKTDTFTVTVTATPAALSSISASFNPGTAKIYESTSLDSLKQYLTVTATYSDSSTETIASTDYTLSGTLTVGTSTVTVTYANKTTTFSVYVHAVLPSGYTELEYIATDGSQYIDPQITSGSVRHVEYEIMVTALNSDDTSLSSSDQSYQKGNHIFSGRNCYFPYLTGNSTGWRTTLYGNRFGSQTPSGESETNLFDWNLNQRYVLSGFANSELKVDGVTKYHLDVGGSATGETMVFFAYGYEANKRKYRFRGRMYYAKMYDANNALVHYFVPCKNGSDVVGMYDLVGETFVSSATSDALIAGEVV